MDNVDVEARGILVFMNSGVLVFIFYFPPALIIAAGLQELHLRLQGRLDAAWLDETDYVGAWQSRSLAAVVLPTANTLGQVRDIA